MASEQQTRTEQHFFSMPNTCEMFLAALAAVQDYYKWLSKRKIFSEITLHSPNEKLDFLSPAFERPGEATLKEIRRDTVGLTLDQFDQAVRFDPDLAYRQAVKTEKHVTQIFGMMVGSEPIKAIPDISSITDGITPNRDIVVLPFPGSEQVYEFIVNNKPELDTECVSPRDVHYSQAFAGRLVVGVRSGMTYLAASAGRAVVEIYPTDQHRDWISKWSHPLYQMIYGNPGEVRPELVYRACEVMWKKVDMRTRALAVKA